jgi:hypothetical protein
MEFQHYDESEIEPSSDHWNSRNPAPKRKVEIDSAA